MKNVSTLTISFSIIVFALLSLTIDTVHADSVSPPRPTDDISRSKAAFAVVGEEIARGLNLHILSESDYLKIRGPVLLEPQTDIHYQLRKQFGRIVNTVDFRASLDTGSPSQNSPRSPKNKPVLYQKASEIIRDFIGRRYISVIIASNAPIGIGEMAAIRGLQGEAHYTSKIINCAAVFIPLKNLAFLIKLSFIAEVWPDSKANLALEESVPQIGANTIHNAPHANHSGLGVTGNGVRVAVVDTGIDKNHPAFGRRVIDERGLTNAIANENHGTIVAGIIGAAPVNKKLSGVAPGVEFLDANTALTLRYLVDFVMFLDGNAAYSQVMNAVEWASHEGRPRSDYTADVVNISLGISPWKYGWKGDDKLSELIDKIVEKGIVVVVSAGNKAQNHASGQVLNQQTKKHQFNSNYETEKVLVTLLWDNESNDLDLVIIDSKGQKVEASENHEGRLGWHHTWADKNDYTFYEQVRLDVSLNNEYTVRVIGHNVTNSQAYEVWLEGGNSGATDAKFLQFNFNNEKTVRVPGYSAKAITVGAVDGQNHIADFSSRGPSGTNLIKPEVVAPGVEIQSTASGGGYDIGTGTSAAAPHVAGVAALILDAVGKNDAGEWNFSPDEVKSAIVRGAEDITGANTPNNTSGAGLVRADNIIFGGTVYPGQKSLFRITPRLTARLFNCYELNAENGLSVAISSAKNFHDLSLSIYHRDGTHASITGTEAGSNYQKTTSCVRPGDFFYLNIYYRLSLNNINKPITFTGASTHPIEEINGKLDVNSDGVVNVKDLAKVADVLTAAKKLRVPPTNPNYSFDADVNNDNDVDMDDMEAIVEEITDAAAALPAPQVEIETIQQWLSEAKRIGNIDPDSLQSIEMLEQLLALLTPIVPQETALLPNYPNPFNPETWIPYQLAEPADVSIAIYTVDGKLVRTLDLGHRPVGSYQTRSRAAHWDGRNAVGEPVVSGVYFYTLKAGDFTATRKMLIRK